MKILIELSDKQLQLLTEEEFDKMNEELDEFDGIYPYIIKGYVYDKLSITKEGINEFINTISKHL
jgi:hypothetical protein